MKKILKIFLFCVFFSTLLGLDSLKNSNSPFAPKNSFALSAEVTQGQKPLPLDTPERALDTKPKNSLVSPPPLDSPQIPTVNLSIFNPQKPTDLVTTLNFALIITLLVLAPSLVLVMTSFPRLIIVFGFLRNALGTQQSPPTQILVTFALVLTFFIMEPVATKSYESGIKPYIDEQIGYDEAFSLALEPFKEFMLKNTREKDLALFYRIRGESNPQSMEEVPLTTLIPAFLISELKTAFQIGFLLYLPFLVIDMVVSSVLMSMGMMMLPPVMMSLPFKVLLFVLVDGFNLLVLNLVGGFK